MNTAHPFNLPSAIGLGIAKSMLLFTSKFSFTLYLKGRSATIIGWLNTSPIPYFLCFRARPRMIGVIELNLHSACIVFDHFLHEMWLVDWTILSFSSCVLGLGQSALLLRYILCADCYKWDNTSSESNGKIGLASEADWLPSTSSITQTLKRIIKLIGQERRVKINAETGSNKNNTNKERKNKV